jgi:arginine repressor
MANTAAQIAEDDAAIAKQREMFGDASAAQLAADLYKLRRTPDNSLMGRFPRGLVVLIAIWVALLETADKLPKLLLSIPQYEATLAEYHAKLLQPDLVQAQLDKARYDAKAAAISPDLASVQLDKTKLETKAAAFQPDLTQAQLDKARFDAKAAAISPDMASVQLDKTRLETKAAAFQPDLIEAQLDKARFDAKAAVVSPDLALVQLEKTKSEAKAATFQPALTAAQAFKAEVDSVAGGSTSDGHSSTWLDNMFDLLDPNHPSLVSRGLYEPDTLPLRLLLRRDSSEHLPRPAGTAQSTDTGSATPKDEKCKSFVFNGVRTCD